MASLAINQNLLINYARPQLDGAKKYINQARSQANSLNIPSSFYYRNYLQNLAKSLLNVENSIKSVNNKIVINVDNVNSIEKKTYAKTSRISSLMSGLVSDLDFGKSGSTIRAKVNTTKRVNAVHAALEKASDRFDDALKKTSADIVNGISSFWANVKDFWNSVKKKAGDVLDWLKETGAKIGKTVSGWCKSAWDWISTVAAPAVWDVLKKTASLICVAVQSVINGLLQVVEAVVDLVCIVGLGIASIGTGIYDGINAIYCSASGEEYKSATAAMWRGSMGFIAKGHVKSWFDALNNTAYGKWLNENSFGDWARTDGMISQIAEGIGYAVGVIVLTVATFGAATPLTLATTAGSLALSKYTAEAWNNNKLTISDGTNSYDIAVDYEELSKLKNGQTLEKTMEYTDENGNIQTTSIIFTRNEDGSYSALINGQTLSVAIDETGILEGLSYGLANGVWEFGQWYIGGKIGSSTFGKAFSGLSSTGQRIITSGSRIVLDSATGAVEVPFRSLLDMLYDDMTWEEAWNKNGGWNSVLSQTFIAGLMSTGGEAFDLGSSKFFKVKNKTDVDVNTRVSSDYIDLNAEYKINSDIAKKYKNAEELYEAFVNKKTKMNMKEYVEAMDFFKVRDNISLKNKTGMTLEELFFDDDYVIGVHRAGNGNTQSILDNGLYLTGHQSSGAFTNDVKLERNITFHDDYFGFIKALAEGSSYKTGGVGYGDAIIVKIPKADINNLDKILTSDGTTSVLKPDYIEGYIHSSVNPDGKINLDDIKFNKKSLINNINTRITETNILSDFSASDISRMKQQLNLLDEDKLKFLLSSESLSDENIKNILSLQKGERVINIENLSKKTLMAIEKSDKGFCGYIPLEGSKYWDLERSAHSFSNADSIKRNIFARSIYFERTKNMVQNALERFKVDIKNIAGISGKELDNMIIERTGGKENIKSLAEYCVKERNDDKIIARAFNSFEEIKVLEARNKGAYNDPIGPSLEDFYKEKAKKLNTIGNFTNEDVYKEIVCSSLRKDEITNTLLGFETK